ncbi:MAG TPA: RCC1 domain-containing protein, partial [Myxococcota bacterium]|nr:RCC1 domain-containing protein [Myxococcota bacterium]
MAILRYLRGLCVVASLCGSEAAAEVAIEVAAGSRHTCALTAQGGARCWGSNDLQELGDGTSTPSGVPVEVVGLPGPLTAIGVGDGVSCGLSAGGAVLCWGHGVSPLSGPPTVLPGLESGIASIDFGNYKKCVVTTAGGVLCGASEWTAVPGLASGVAQVAAGMDFACALSTSGGVSCWGDNFQGQLGADRETVPYSETPLEVAGLSGVASISAGLTHA